MKPQLLPSVPRTGEGHAERDELYGRDAQRGAPHSLAVSSEIKNKHLQMFTAVSKTYFIPVESNKKLWLIF